MRPQAQPMLHVILTGRRSSLSVLAILAILAALAALAAPAAPALAGLNNVKVVTDTSIDCTSAAAIAADLYKDCKSEQDKAIATWYFVRRACFHWPEIPTYDLIELINSYGFALCGHQSTMLCQIWQAGGGKARLMHPTSHVIGELFYDDAWHMFDCQMGWYVLDKNGKVASVEQLKADKGILAEAEKDGRGSKPFFQCTGKNSGQAVADSAKTGQAPAAYKAELVINLPRGASITRTWANEGKSWYNTRRPDADKWAQPAHLCTGQLVDANDPVNWPFWKPYATINRVEGDKTVYGQKRYFGNGRLEYEPELGSDHFMDGLAKDGLVNAKAKCQDGKGPNLHAGEAGKEASATFMIDCPYVSVEAFLDASAVRKTEQDVLVISARPAKTGEWKELYRAGGSAAATGPAVTADKDGLIKLEKLPLKEAAWQQHQILVKFSFLAGKDVSDVGLERLKLTTAFMNNMYSLPYFKPGKNAVKLTAGEKPDLAANKLSLECAWQEDGAKEDKTLSKQIDKLPFETSLEVGGKELPRMKWVKLAVAP